MRRGLVVWAMIGVPTRFFGIHTTAMAPDIIECAERPPGNEADRNVGERESC
ncbi:MAG TPA: hypothetical protein PLJ27_01610 [Polyangiaceae bacterium]|nr:hypothetical protein [Polyangiaceae bacterium]HPY19334.1 hypothetical protein [Polyangiaceae bacterium]HQB43596.1 hypothetical protein [Polyangiaceae bacterium]HQK16117.1 hypothetical protein [Polyangiaceae bacterium]HQM11056.1 hypothetical protein [Polyangiaceae bacterium]